MCKHEAVLEILQIGKGRCECLVAHYKPDGSNAPACIVCPDCNKYVSWSEQDELLGLPCTEDDTSRPKKKFDLDSEWEMSQIVMIDKRVYAKEPTLP